MLKHAGPEPNVEISLQATGNRVDVRVRDDGQGAARAGSGHGITGMRERAELLGGSLHAGARDDGQRGFEVTASLPLEPA